MRRPPDHTVTRHALTAAPATPLLVGTNDTASQHRTVGFEPLPRDLKTTLIKPTNRAQVGGIVVPDALIELDAVAVVVH